jgi:putative cardiolipin synthase
VAELLERRVPWHRGEALVLADAPEKLLTAPSDTTGHLMTELGLLLDSAGTEMLILSPYFVPQKEGVDYLTGLVRRGVRVRVLTNALASTDVWVVHSGYAKYREALLRGGVELYEVKATREGTHSAQQDVVGSSGRASLHAKTFVIDRERLFIGSLNLDPRSWRLNTEMGIALKSEALSRMIADWVDTNLDQIAYRVELVPACAYPGDCWGDEMRLRWRDQTSDGVRYWDVEPGTGAGTRLLADFVGLFPIDGQL